MHTREVAQRAVSALPDGVKELYFRGDSACYDEKLLKYLVKEEIAFTISADVTPELRRVCAQPDLQWALLEGRPRETVDFAEIEFTPGDWPKAASPLRYIALRISPCQASLFSDSPKYLAIVSNRWQISSADLVRWHWEKAGTIELTHDVTKNDLAAGGPSQWQVRGQRRLVPDQSTDLQPADRATSACSAGALPQRQTQATALRGLHHCGRDQLPRPTTDRPARRSSSNGRRVDRCSWALARLAGHHPGTRYSLCA
jgi:hypothetical protein